MVTVSIQGGLAWSSIVLSRGFESSKFDTFPSVFSNYSNYKETIECEYLSWVCRIR